MMRFVTTRGGTAPVSLSDAIVQGIGADGGLFVPERLPAMPWTDFPSATELPALAARVIAPFAEGDPLAPVLADVCREAFDFPAPLVRLQRAPGQAYALELFHGPTCAFKDFGARFLAAALQRLHGPREPKVTILVATSGDTGGAVAACQCGSVAPATGLVPARRSVAIVWRTRERMPCLGTAEARLP